ncbi:MAG: response regulator transcription factor [Clostridiales bacterium]|nr:response regulator transcription factor [Clostridiales bacterium]
MAKILVVEDDRAINGLVCSCLKSEGYETTACYDGEEGLNAFAEGTYSLIISDIMMPKMDGFVFAEEVRARNKQIPILFMTAKDDKPSKLYAYRLGVDDYVVKPFDIDVFVLKVSAILRRMKIEEKKVLTVGNLTMNAEERTVTVDGEELSLTVREFDLLFKFLSYPKKTFTRSALMDEFWDYDSSATSRTVDVYMAKLRDKTSACDGFEIVTVHGLGYKAVLK